MNDPYMSHMEVLEFVCQYLDPLKRSLELGMGYYSTGMLLQYSNELVSVETESDEWYKKIRGLYDKYRHKWTPVYSADASTELDYLQLLVQANVDGSDKIDLIMVDGRGSNRAKAVELAQYAARVVVVHDTEVAATGFDNVKLEPGMGWVNIKDKTPWTSVLTFECKLLFEIQKKFKGTSTR